MRLRLVFLISLIGMAGLAGCATRTHVQDEYLERIEAKPTVSKRTTIVFLVDGLSQKILNETLDQLPNLKRFFNTDQGIYQAHTGFPSLTFPSIASLLKQQPISQTDFIGNTFYSKGEFINFESPTNRKKVGELMKTDNVFSKLDSHGETSASLDYGIGTAATVFSPIEDLNSIVQIADGNYTYADEKKLESLALLLSNTDARNWPSFIFVHLIGVDFNSHSHGARSPEALAYLMGLDEKLAPVFDLLTQNENRHQIVSLLTADHGFVPETKYFVDIDSPLAKTSASVINESRMAAIYVKDASEKDYVTHLLLAKLGVELIAQKTLDGFSVESKTQKVNVQLRASTVCKDDRLEVSLNRGATWLCADASEAMPRYFNYPYLITNLAFYFAAKSSPDLVAIPDSETAFTKLYIGYHGGPTADETLVPLLIRNGKLAGKTAPPLWHLLKFVE